MIQRKKVALLGVYCAPECAKIDFCTESGILQTSTISATAASIDDAVVDDTWNF